LITSSFCNLELCAEYYSVSFFSQYFTNENSKSFEIKEELAPNGHTHGGFGFVDAKGDLVFTEYAKDAQGQL